MNKQNLYEVLGVEKTDSVETIKKAYRKKARENHPDRNPGDAQAEARFKEAQEAWDVLSNEKKRAYYDQTGKVLSDSEEDRKIGMILRIVAKVFAEVINQQYSGPAAMFDGGTIIGKDIVALMKSTIEMYVIGLKDNIKHFEKAKKELIQTKAKIKVKSGDNHLASIIGMQITENEKQQAEMKQAMEEFKETLKFLEDYSLDMGDWNKRYGSPFGELTYTHKRLT